MSQGTPKRGYATTEADIAERRDAIMAAAAEIISRTGVEGCSFGAVSDATGYSIGMIQHYFRSRDRLLLATVEFSSISSIREWETTHASGTTAVERLHDLLTFAVMGEVSFERAWGFWIEVYSAAHKDAGIRTHVAHALQSWREAIVRTLTEATAEGLISPFHDVQTLATLMLAVIDGLAVQALNGIYDRTPQTMVETLHRFAAHECGIDFKQFADHKRSSLTG